jgi:hypothetical protein
MAGETVRAALNEAWSALEPLGHPCALMGGVALTVWNHPRATRDVDLLIAVESDSIQPVIESMKASGFRPKKSPPLITVGTHHFVQFLYTPLDEAYDVQIDLLPAESDYQRSAITRRVQRQVPGIILPIDVLSCDDLILFKPLAGRVIDRADAAMLLRENRDAIDVDYLNSWAARLDLTTLLAEIWIEAYPEESLPAGHSQ